MKPLKVSHSATEPTITITRILNAPPALVWEAWTEPRHIARWYGNGTSKIVEHDFRVGGRWRYEDTDAEGNVWAFAGKFVEIAPTHRLVNTFGVVGMFDGSELTETHSFADMGDGRTRYTSVSVFDTMEQRDGMLASGMEDGADISMDLLDALLQQLKVDA
jgi:uncharacterized protein YndB with AHSA1/START domain